MSWTDVFPVLTDEHVEEFENDATEPERLQMEEWFGVKKIYKASVDRPSAKHIVSTTLFWKNVGATDPELPKASRYRLIHARRLGLVKRFDFWETYFEPFIFHTDEIRKRNQEVSFRIYLAADLDFLVEDLTQVGWEVHLMKSPSIRYCPGGFWRFLALSEKGRFVTMIDADRVMEVDAELVRTKLMQASNLGLWRVPGYYNAKVKKDVAYRPILGGHFGALGGLPVKKLMMAFTWHLLRGSLPTAVNLPGCGSKPLRYLKWPGYGIDENFQLMALYPRMAPRGTLTFIPSNARSMILPLDIEYATWANRRSEVVYVSNGGCC